jgi:signal transduction histidine kinase
MTGFFMTAYRQQEQRFQLVRRAEARERLESLGRMAAGLAHDLSAIFNAIKIAAEEGTRINRDEEVHAMLEPLSSSARRGADMVERLLAYARSAPVDPAVIELGPYLRESLPFFDQASGRGCQLELIGEGTPGAVLIDPSSLDQVVLNLVGNAAQSMPDGGPIGLHLDTTELESSRTIGVDQILEGRWIVLSVIDRGSGLDPAEAERIFEPFFTTRAGTGMGLGLATVLSIVRGAGGAVEVASEPGRGTRISCWFPHA